MRSIWSQTSTKTILLLFLLSLSFNLCFSFFFPHMHYDSPYYDRVGWNIAQGHGFSMSKEAPYKPYFKKPIGYYLFLGIVYYLFGHNYTDVFIAQSLVNALTVIIVFLIARMVFDQNIATITGAIMALDPFYGFYASTILTETLFTFFLVISMYLLIRSAKEETATSIRWSILAGIMIGIATLVKNSVQYLPLFAAALYFILIRSKKIALRNSILLIAAYCIIVLPWMIRTYHHFGKFKIATLNPIWSIYAATFEYQGVDWREQPAREREGIGGLLPHINTIMDSDDFNEVEASYEHFSKLAGTRIRNHPWLYLRTIPIRFFRIWISTYTPNTPQFILILITIYCSGFLILGLSGIIISRGFWRETLWLLIILLYLNFASSFVPTRGRYTFPLRGMMTIFVSVSIYQGINWLRSRKTYKRP